MNFPARNVYMRLALSAALVSSVSAPAFAQTADEKRAEDYSQVLNRIGDLKMTIAQKEAYIATQEAEIKSLQDQIAMTAETKDAVGPMLDKMATAIESEIKSDLPFKAGERYARLDKLNETIKSADVLPVEKMRSALSIYNIEVGYGQTLEAYPGDHPMAEKAGTRYAACEADTNSRQCGLDKKQVKALEGGATLFDLKEQLKDGNYLRYGRVSLEYMLADESEALRYDQATKAWVPLSQSKILDVRRGIRIAKGDSAPGVVTAPVVVSN